MTSVTLRQFKQLFPATKLQELKPNFNLILEHYWDSDTLQDLVTLSGVPISHIHNIEGGSYHSARGVCMINAMCLCIMLTIAAVKGSSGIPQSSVSGAQLQSGPPITGIHCLCKCTCIYLLCLRERTRQSVVTCIPCLDLYTIMLRPVYHHA